MLVNKVSCLKIFSRAGQSIDNQIITFHNDNQCVAYKKSSFMTSENSNKSHPRKDLWIFRRFTHPVYPSIFFGLLGVFLGWLSVQNHPRSPLEILGLWSLGVFSWTLVEYFLHRHVFHLTQVKEPWRTLASGLHMAHHDNPDAKDLIVAPPLVSIIFGSIIYLIFLALTQSFGVSTFLITGLFTGYCTYEWVHYATHQYPMTSKLSRYIKKYHLQHHHKHPDAGFGVTSPIWDRVFGTFPHNS